MYNTPPPRIPIMHGSDVAIRRDNIDIEVQVTLLRNGRIHSKNYPPGRTVHITKTDEEVQLENIIGVQFNANNDTLVFNKFTLPGECDQ